MPSMDRATLDEAGFGSSNVVGRIVFSVLFLGLALEFSLHGRWLPALLPGLIWAAVMGVWWFSRSPKPAPKAVTPFDPPSHALPPATQWIVQLLPWPGGIGFAMVWTHHNAVYGYVGVGISVAMFIALFGYVIARGIRNRRHA
jgi:hypothetical protein